MATMRAAKPVRPAAAVRDSSAASSSRRLPGRGEVRASLLTFVLAERRRGRDETEGFVDESSDAKDAASAEDESGSSARLSRTTFSEAANEAEDAPADLLRRGLLKVGEAGASALADATVDELASVAAAEATDDATSSRREACARTRASARSFSCRAFNSRGLLVRGRLPSPATAANEPVARLICSSRVRAMPEYPASPRASWDEEPAGSSSAEATLRRASLIMSRGLLPSSEDMIDTDPFAALAEAASSG